MTYCDFQTTAHGKWILVGEHSVVRGTSAIVFPITTKKLTLKYLATSQKFNVEYTGYTTGLEQAFWQVLKYGQHLLGKSIHYGDLHLHNTIPIGVGLGASAALCVVIARWFVAQDFLKATETYLLAKNLENLFHKKSSGLDIAGASANCGIYFQQGQIYKLKQAWKPQWFLSASGQISSTAECIDHVNNMLQNNASIVTGIDAKMQACVSKARLNLEYNEPESLLNLATAIKEAATCFQEWGLVSMQLKQHMQTLMDYGALAVKPTGSGKGGFVISLWDTPPPPTILTNLIAV